MATNLVDDLGEGYIREWFVGALIRRDDNLFSIRGCRGGVVEAYVADLNLSIPEWSSTSLPKETFSNFSDISWPKLGYRNLLSGDRGNVAAFVTHQRSVMRGLRQDLLEWKIAEVATQMGVNPWGHSPSGNTMYQLREVFRPTFYSYREGMLAIKEGRWCSFALNEDLAIAVSNTVVGGFCDILFRDKIVGRITEDGDIHLSNKVIKRSTLRRMFSET